MKCVLMTSLYRSIPVIAASNKSKVNQSALHPSGKLSQSAWDTLVVTGGVVLAYTCAFVLNLSEKLNAWLSHYEYAQLDEIPLTLFACALLSVWFSHRRIREIRAEIQRRTLAEQQLLASQHLYKTLFDGDLTGNVVLDLEGNIGMHNRAFDRLCRPLPADSSARNLFTFDWMPFIQELQAHQEINFNKLQIRRPDGLPCYVGARFIYVHAQSGQQAQIHGYLVDMTEQCLVELDLERTLKENRILARHAMQVQEQERKYIASEIHDETGQYLTAIRMDALALQKSSPDQVNVIAVRIASNTSHVQQSVRALIKHLRPPALDSLGLIGAIERLVADWQKLSPGIACQLRLEIAEQPLTEDINIVAFRVVQEALTNIARHAEATEIWINAQVVHRANGPMLQIEIRDNGKGMDSSVQVDGVGLVGMRERIESLHGTFKLMSGPQAGTLITSLIPLTTVADQSLAAASPPLDSGAHHYATP